VWYWNKQDPPYSVTVYQILQITEFNDGNGPKLLAIAKQFENIPEFLQPAVDAAMDKARCYHCRSPHYSLI
jgi:hypothetical protein